MEQIANKIVKNTENNISQSKLIDNKIATEIYKGCRSHDGKFKVSGKFNIRNC